MMKAEITLHGAEADVVEAALRPEAREAVPRANVAIERVGQELRIAIEAEDTTALRAATNSYLRWATVASRMAEAANHE